MSDKPLLVTELDGGLGVAVLLINRPEKKNALSVALIHELTAQIRSIHNNPQVRCLVLKGAGDSFCAGRDLQDLRASYGQRSRFGDDTDAVIGVVRALREAPQITIACVRGYCLGGGLVLLNGCDLAVVADDAKIGMPEILRGSYGRSATPTLFHSRVPNKHAFLLQLTGENISGSEAVRIGLASRSVPAGQLHEHAIRLAREIASRDPVALEHAKIAAYSVLDLPFYMAPRFDESISQRQRMLTNPVGDIENYLKSQKGGTNKGYRPDDKEGG